VVQVKTLKPHIWPTALVDLERHVFKVADLRIIPSDDWIDNRSKEFGYQQSFDNYGMMYPIAASTHDHRWVQDRLKLKNKAGEYKNPHHIDEQGLVIPGYYCHVGNKRVWYAQQHGFTHIEGFLITTHRERELVKMYTHIKHTEIPK